MLLCPLLLFSHWVVSDSLQPQGLQQARTPSPSLFPGVCPNSCPLTWWYHPTSVCPLLLLLSIFPSKSVFSHESALRIRWPKYCSFSISPSKEHSGLSSFKTDWFDLLAVPWTLKSRLQHYSSKASILQCSAFFVVQLSYPYMTTGKTIADFCQQSDIPAYLHAVYVCHSFLSKEQSSFNFMAAVTICSDFGAQENKICHCFHFSAFYLPWSNGTMIFGFWMLHFKLAFSVSSFTLIRGSLLPLCFLPL